MHLMEDILTEIAAVIGNMRESELIQAAERLSGAKRIFVMGEGRSGLMAKAFAMRLMHLGAHAYVVGETITPSIAAGDVLVAVSGSGMTHHVVWTAEKAGRQGVFVIALSANSESAIAVLADLFVFIPAATKFRREGEAASLQPLGSLFDQSAHIAFDAICLQFAKIWKIGEAEALKAHSNLES